jgi:lysyl-tRNA synthetase class 2
VAGASIFSSFWGNLEDNHEQAVFLVLVGFVGSFAFIRMSTRIIRSESVSWWPGNVESESGLHLHHLVFGIVTMMTAGTLGFVSDGRAPFAEICALLFGIGVGLTIDEFALWVHLEDVYWEREGRSSIDATVIAGSLMLLVVLGASPFAIESGSTETLLSSILGGLLVLAFVVISLLKGRVLHGTIGFFFAPIAIYGACRIGKPGSTWARYRYGERRPRKQAKAEDRFAPERRTERFKEAFRDMVGGKPSEGLAAVGDEAVAATREAGAEVRGQAERLAHAADPRERKSGDE